MDDRKLWISWALMAFAVALILFAVWGLSSNRARSEPVTRETCVDVKTRDRIRELSLSAIDQALYAHVMNLYDVWLKDPSQQPQRAKVGMANGISAYRRARADALAWNPETCKE